MTIDSQPFGVFEEFRRIDPIGQPPSGHSVGLAPAVEEDNAVADILKFQKAHMFVTVIKHAAVNLVAQHRHPRMFGQSRRQPFHFFARRHAAGGIGGAVEDDKPGARRNQGEHFLGVEGKAVFLAVMQGYRGGSGKSDDRFIGQESGVGINDLGPGFAEYKRGIEQDRLAAGRDQNRGGVNFRAPVFGDVGGHCHPQFGDSARRGIAVTAVFQRLAGGFHDMVGGREIRLADTHMNNVLTLGFQGLGAGQHLEGAVGAKPGHGRGRCKHGWSSVFWL